MKKTDSNWQPCSSPPSKKKKRGRVKWKAEWYLWLARAIIGESGREEEEEEEGGRGGGGPEVAVVGSTVDLHYIVKEL